MPGRGTRISLRLFRTPAQRKVAKKQSHRRLRFAALRVDLASARLPEFLLGINLPSVGIIRDGLDAYTWDSEGRKVNGAGEMRKAQGLQNAAGLVQAFGQRNHTRPVAWTGSGNTVQNLGCVAYIGSSGALYRSVGEEKNILRGYDYPSLVIYRDGKVGISDVRFSPSTYPDRWNANVRRNDNVHLIVTGQRLVENGVALDPYADLDRALRYPDKRHLIQNPYPKMANVDGTYPKNGNGNRIRRDFGLDQISDDAKKYERALTGEITCLSFLMTDFDGTKYKVRPADLREALEEKGYDMRDRLTDVKTRGECFIDKTARLLQIRFKKNSYPHHFVATRIDEPRVLYDGVIGGWGNNGGTNPHDLALDLQESGFDDAILLDNGGDAVLCHKSNKEFPRPTKATVPSCEKREEWAGVIVYHVPPDESGISLAQGKHERGFRFTAQF